MPRRGAEIDHFLAVANAGGMAVIWFFTESWGKSSLRARLRTRKDTGRDASLPAPLLATSLGLVGRGAVGALPQTPQGTLSLDPARGRRKGTKSPLDPFSRLSWSRFHAPSACSFLGLRLSPCLLPLLSVKSPFFSALLSIHYRSAEPASCAAGRFSAPRRYPAANCIP